MMQEGSQEGIFLGMMDSPSTLLGASLLTGRPAPPLPASCTLASTPVINININQQMAAPSSVSGVLVLPDYFPTTLPVTRLTAAERRNKYGLGFHTPSMVKEQIKAFIKWSTDDVQLSRAGTYSAAVQFTTTEKQETCILAFLGYLANVRTDVSDERLDMSAYDQPKWIAGFISYLMARDVGRGHVIKHISLARKVNNWLVSGEWVSGWVILY